MLWRRTYSSKRPDSTHDAPSTEAAKVATLRSCSSIFLARTHKSSAAASKSLHVLHVSAITHPHGGGGGKGGWSRKRHPVCGVRLTIPIVLPARPLWKILAPPTFLNWIAFLIGQKARPIFRSRRYILPFHFHLLFKPLGGEGRGDRSHPCRDMSVSLGWWVNGFLVVILFLRRDNNNHLDGRRALHTASKHGASISAAVCPVLNSRIAGQRLACH